MDQSLLGPKEVLLNILKIVDYQDNKEKFIEDFIRICYDRTLSEMIKKLPMEKQTEFEKILKRKNNLEIAQASSEYFSTAEYAKQLSITTATAFAECLENIINLITPSQKQKLKNYFDSQMTEEQRFYFKSAQKKI